jgi:hypothetical protein
MGSVDLTTREGALEFLEAMQRLAAGEFAKLGEVAPCSYVLAGRDIKTGEVLRLGSGEPVGVAVIGVTPTTIDRPSDRDAWGTFLKAAAARSQAVGVLMVSEVWHAVGSLEKGERGGLPNDFAEPFDGRREGIMLWLEHVALERPIHRIAEIVRGAEGTARTLQTFEDWPVEGIEGRFVGLLKRAES